MRTLAWMCMALAVAGTAEAQRWDAGISASAMEVRPEDDGTRYSDQWFLEGRYALSIGRYWTEHLKTEFEFAHASEGSRYVNEMVVLAGTPYPSAYQQFHRLQQATGRVVWRFGRNAWVHPYMGAGVVVDIDRQRRFVSAQYQPPSDPRGTPTLIRPEHYTEPVTQYRVGGTVNGGAKFYMTPSSYFNAGMVVSYARPTVTISFLGGLGIEF